MRVNSTTIPSNPPSYSSLTPHDPISISSDSYFAIFPGTGTKEDPYVIEGYEIITSQNRGIYITGTTKHFTVRNCYVEARWSGIYIGTVADGTATVINNTCNNNENGINLHSSDCVVTYNLVQKNIDYGICLSSSADNNIIHHNIFVDNNLGSSSQAIDNGKKNKWYDTETKEGNYWSDLGDECTYKIDGDAHSKDLYPLNRAQSCLNPITMTILTIVLPLLVGVAILAFVVPKYAIPYTRKTIIPYFRKRKAERQDRIAKLLFCPNCRNSVKLSSTFCENCGTTLPKRKRFVLSRKRMLLYKSKLIESSNEELMKQLIINIVIAILFVLVISTEIVFVIILGGFLAAHGGPGFLIGGIILAPILIMPLIFFTIPRFAALLSEKKTRRRKK